MNSGLLYETYFYHGDTMFNYFNSSNIAFFQTTPPDASGVISSIDNNWNEMGINPGVTVNSDFNFTNYCVKISGYFYAPVNGTYTFSFFNNSNIATDDLSYFYFGGSALEPTLDNITFPVNYLTYYLAASWSTVLEEGQYYPMLIYYGQSIGGYTLAMGITPPGGEYPSYDGTGYYFHELNGLVGGDPQIKTLSGKIYTVPDYLDKFDYLVMTKGTRELKIECTTRRLTEDDAVSDYREGKYITLSASDCPHTYLDKIYIYYDGKTIVIDMDTLTSNNNSYLSSLAPRGLRCVNGYQYPLLETTKYMILNIGPVCLQLWSDVTLFERHNIETRICDIIGWRCRGAIVDRPCHNFISTPEILDNIRGDTIMVRINGKDIPYMVPKEERLLSYLRTHSFKCN